MPYTEVMHKFKGGDLHSGGKQGPVVKSRKQAIAIMLSEKRAAGDKPEYRGDPKDSPSLKGLKKAAHK